MIRRFCVWICVLILCAVPFAALAHSGGTDGAGGHYDHYTGEYHYHHGYPAHQHENGKCPYDYDNNVKRHNSTGTTKTTEATKTVPYIPSWIIFVIIVLSITILIMFLMIRFRNRTIADLCHKLDESKEKIKSIEAEIEDAGEKAAAPHIQQVEDLEEKMSSLKSRLHNIEAANATLMQKIKVLRLRIRVPKNVSVADDGLPILFDYSEQKPYGGYTVFCSRKNDIYHAEKYCAPSGSEIKHLFHVFETGRPCKKCASRFADFKSIPDWYKNEDSE